MAASKINRDLNFAQHNSGYAEVVIPLYLPLNYTWAIPAHLQEAVIPGVRVEVALRNKKYTGIVKKIFAAKPPTIRGECPRGRKRPRACL